MFELAQGLSSHRRQSPPPMLPVLAQAVVCFHTNTHPPLSVKGENQIPKSGPTPMPPNADPLNRRFSGHEYGGNGVNRWHPGRSIENEGRCSGHESSIPRSGSRHLDLHCLEFLPHRKRCERTTFRWAPKCLGNPTWTSC